MLVAVSNCVSHGGALFFRKPREARPPECSLLDLHELAGETGISVDDVISQLDDFAYADTLLGFGAPFFSPPRETTPLETSENISVFSVRTSFDPADTIIEQTAAIFEETKPVFEEPEPPVFAEPVIETAPPMFTEPEPVVETESPLFTKPEPVVEAEIVVQPIDLTSEPKIEAVTETPSPEADVEPVVEPIIEVETAAIPEPMIEAAPMVPEPVVEAEPAPPVPKKSLWHKRFISDQPLAKMTRAKLEKIRKVSTVRVEAAEPEDDGEDEHLIDMTVPEGYAVQTTTENIVWPWEIREDLTLKEALEALDDKLLASLTEEVVSCTISGQMGEGGIKSLCETYNREKEQIYSAVQHESRRRITRMNTKPHTAAAGSAASDATLEMAMRMTKQFLQNEMGKKAMRFQSPIPDENGICHIIQSHRVEDEDSVEFPNERVYYREIGDGWAISVGY